MFIVKPLYFLCFLFGLVAQAKAHSSLRANSNMTTSHLETEALLDTDQVINLVSMLGSIFGVGAVIAICKICKDRHDREKNKIQQIIKESAFASELVEKAHIDIGSLARAKVYMDFCGRLKIGLMNKVGIFPSRQFPSKCVGGLVDSLVPKIERALHDPQSEKDSYCQIRYGKLFFKKGVKQIPQDVIDNIVASTSSGLIDPSYIAEGNSQNQEGVVVTLEKPEPLEDSDSETISSSDDEGGSMTAVGGSQE